MPRKRKKTHVLIFLAFYQTIWKLFSNFDPRHATPPVTNVTIVVIQRNILYNNESTMNTKIKKTLLTVGLSSSVMLSMAQTPSATATTTNPLLIPSTLSYGAPDFNRIKASDYLPALEAAIAQQRKAINAIAESKQTPTFRNTILAYENSGKLLDRVSSIFFCVDEADKTPEIAATEKAIMPQLTQLDNDISFNEKLFHRVKYVYDHEFAKLKGEDRRLLEEIYKGFVRNGALLSKEKKTRVEQINKRISDLQQQWGTQLQEATNNAVVWVNSKEELAGLSDADIAQCE